MSDWQSRLHELLPSLGHRNWIVVADAAYPLQSNPGIETLVSGDDIRMVLKIVLDYLATSAHVRPLIHLDAELACVPEARSPGIDAFRAALDELLRGLPVTSLPHEEIITKLDQAARLFNILLIKTPFTCPYTSVFIQLDCGYWSAEAEAELRARLARG